VEGRVTDIAPGLRESETNGGGAIHVIPHDNAAGRRPSLALLKGPASALQGNLTDSSLVGRCPTSLWKHLSPLVFSHHARSEPRNHCLVRRYGNNSTDLSSSSGPPWTPFPLVDTMVLKNRASASTTWRQHLRWQHDHWTSGRWPIQWSTNRDPDSLSWESGLV